MSFAISIRRFPSTIIHIATRRADSRWARPRVRGGCGMDHALDRVRCGGPQLLDRHSYAPAVPVRRFLLLASHGRPGQVSAFACAHNAGTFELYFSVRRDALDSSQRRTEASGQEFRMLRSTNRPDRFKIAAGESICADFLAASSAENALPYPCKGGRSYAAHRSIISARN